MIILNTNLKILLTANGGKIMIIKEAYNSQLKDSLVAHGSSWSLKFQCFVELVKRRIKGIKIG